MRLLNDPKTNYKVNTKERKQKHTHPKKRERKGNLFHSGNYKNSIDIMVPAVLL
jgi:hypothetical protein